MKVDLVVFHHASNGMQIDLIPETAFEVSFLRAFSESDAKFVAGGKPQDNARGGCAYSIRIERGDMTKKEEKAT